MRKLKIQGLTNSILVSHQVLKMGFKPRASNCNNHSPKPSWDSPIVILKASWEKEHFSIVCTQQQTLPPACLRGCKSKDNFGIHTAHLLSSSGSAKWLFIPQPSWEYDCFSVSLHSSFSEGIILTGNNFKPSSVSVGGEGKEWGGSARCLKSYVWKPSHQ